MGLGQGGRGDLPGAPGGSGVPVEARPAEKLFLTQVTLRSMSEPDEVRKEGPGHQAPAAHPHLPPGQWERLGERALSRGSWLGRE